MRYKSLQIGRGLAALAVVLHHAIGRAKIDHVVNPLADYYVNGFLGVDFFFVLSGFIIAFTVSKAGTTVSEFIKHRLIRIFPVFWLIFGISYLGVMLVPSLVQHGVSYSPIELVKAFFLVNQDISDGRSNPPIIGVAWTLQHEMLFYSMAALFIWSRRAAIVAVTLLLLGSLSPTLRAAHDFVLSGLHLEFAFGVLAFLVHQRLNKGVAIALVVLGGGAMLALPFDMSPLDDQHDLIRVWAFGLPVALVIAGFAALDAAPPPQPDARATSNWFEAMFLWLGDRSYTLYLVHYQIVLASLKLTQKLGMTSFGLYITLTLLSALFVTALIDRLYEGPLRTLLTKRMTKPRSLAVAQAG